MSQLKIFSGYSILLLVNLYRMHFSGISGFTFFEKSQNSQKLVHLKNIDSLACTIFTLRSVKYIYASKHPNSETIQIPI